MSRINPASKSIQEVQQVAHIDWLAFTFTPPPEALQAPILWLLPQLFRLFNLPAVLCQESGKGWNGYTHRVNIGENAEYGLIAYGGEKQRGTVHVELNATACAHISAWHSVQQWGESIGAKITRVDLAHDDMEAKIVSIAIARAWYEAGEFTSNGRPPDAHLIDDMGSGKGIIGGGVLLGVMQALALAAAGFDDDEPPEFIRERNLIFPIGWAVGGKRYISIPMPLGFHAIPNVGRIATEYALGGFKKPADHVFRLMGVFAEAFNPMGSSGISMQTVLPTAFDPFAALEANKDWTGKTIYKEDFSSLDPTPGFTRNKDTAFAWSKFMAEAINYATGGTDYVPGTFSPTADQIDYLIGQVTGGVGREGLKLAQTGQSWFTGEDLPTHKMPLVGRFYGNLENQSSQGAKYYANLKDINAIEAEWSGRNKDGLPTEKFEKENPEYDLIGFTKGTDNKIHMLRRRKTKLISEGASRADIREVEVEITEAMRELNDAVRELRATATP